MSCIFETGYYVFKIGSSVKVAGKKESPFNVVFIKNRNNFITAVSKSMSGKNQSQLLFSGITSNNST